MPNREIRETNRFQAVADDGAAYTVVERTVFTEFVPLSGDRRWVRGARDYVLSDGRDLDPRGDGLFKILDTDQIIRKVG